MATFDKAAKKAAAKGPSIGQGIPNARIPALRPQRTQAHFANPAGPVAPRDELYPGTKRWTKAQQQATGQQR